MNEANNLLKQSIENLLINGKHGGIWSSSGSSYAFANFSFNDGKLLCKRYEFQKYHENQFDGLNDLTIDHPKDFEWEGIQSVEQDGIGVKFTLLSPNDISVDSDKSNVLTLVFYPSL